MSTSSELSFPINGLDYLLIYTANTQHPRSYSIEMSWTLEASFALAALVLTLILSGLGLVLKYRKSISPLGKDTLLQMFVEGTFPLIAGTVIDI